MLYVFFIFVQSHTCLHDSIAKTAPLKVIGRRELLGSKYEVEWENLRIIFNLSFINSTNLDPLSCKSEGQSITWNNNTHTCEKFDILYREQIDYLIKIFDELKDFLENTFKVQREPENPFNLTDWEDVMPKPPEMQAKDCDLHVTVISRPFGMSGPGAVSASLLETNFGRSVQGVVIVNPQMIPFKPPKTNIRQSYLYQSYLHELFHILGISSSKYHKFHAVNNQTAYPNPLCTMTKYGKKFTFLTTPHAHKWALKHYSTEIYEGDNGTSCPSGIELEDGGNDGTYLSHVESRVYFTDVMTAVIHNVDNFHRLTDVTLAILLDTGNYQIDYTAFQPILWGNVDLHGEKLHKGFPIGPPQTVFPESYIYLTDNIGFDYKYMGISFAKPAPTCPSKIYKKYCNGEEFYNPLHSKWIGPDDVFDYTKFKMPGVVCTENEAVLVGMTQCVKYSFIGSETIAFTLKQNTFYCNDKSDPTEDQSFTVDQRLSINYRCPEFMLFKRAMAMSKAYFKDDPFNDKVYQYTEIIEFDGDECENCTKSYGEYRYQGTVQTNSLILIIVSILFVLVITLIIIVVVIMLRNRFVYRIESKAPVKIEAKELEEKDQIIIPLEE